ncbi:MAG: hypothetical protein ABFE07_16460 [Armatimonadia bacterium]
MLNSLIRLYRLIRLGAPRRIIRAEFEILARRMISAAFLVDL